MSRRRGTTLAEERLARTVESLGEGVAATDDAGAIDLFNPVAQRLTGWTWEEASGRPLEEVLRILDEDTGELVAGRLDRVLGEGVTLGLPIHSAVVARDGQRHPIADTLTPIRDRDGRVLGAVCVFRDLTRERNLEQQLRDLARRVEAIREEDRTRIARELHDELGQQLTAIHLDLAWLGPRLGSVRPEVTERLDALGSLVDGTFAMVRRLATELRPQILDELGLLPALEWLGSECERRAGVQVTLRVDAEPATAGAVPDLDAIADQLLASGQSTAVFRIAQEALTNVMRHASATSVLLHLTLEPHHLTLSVVDDGLGFRFDTPLWPPEACLPGGFAPRPRGQPPWRPSPEPRAQPPSSGDPSSVEDPPFGPRPYGLLGMNERVSLSGGTMDVGSTPGGGTTVHVRLPRVASGAT